jgi:hypothetical protein
MIVGGLLAFLGASALRRPAHESISVGEAAISKMSGGDPLLKSKFFEPFERAYHAFLTLIGLILLIVASGSLFWEF